MSRTTPSDSYYDELADSYERDVPTIDEIAGPPILGPGLPTIPEGHDFATDTSVTVVRLPSALHEELEHRSGPAGSESDIIRAALVEYFEKHPQAG
ncbi:hypothetical protein [Gordonia iterans]